MKPCSRRVTNQLTAEGWDIDSVSHEISEQREEDDSSEAEDSSVGEAEDINGQIAISWGDE